MRGVEREAPFAVWCVERSALTVLGEVVERAPSLLAEGGADGRTALHAAAAKGPRFAKLLLAAGMDVAAPDADGLLPVDVALWANKASLAKLLMPPGDLDALNLIKPGEFERRVLEGERPRLPTRAVDLLLHYARLRVDLRDRTGESKSAVAGEVVKRVKVLRSMGARVTHRGTLDVHYFRSAALSAAYFESGKMSAGERRDARRALELYLVDDEPKESRAFAEKLLRGWPI